MKTFTSASQKTGELGEQIACRYFIDRRFTLIERNYTKKWGEIDIIVEKDGVTHFVEVKSVSRENIDDISHETEALRPEDQMHPGKQGRLMRTIETYLAGREVREWQFDLVCVYIDQNAKKARVKVLEDVILG